ncbi:MAG TPA: ABC transporter ATP-binding protein/permease [Candidatus Stackebrandtia faecavium]|nr:ABC transporter ATP-binding protein/permease [Candidatus Stackebrandtia faecavium]
MIRSVLSLLPPSARRILGGYAALMVASVLLRAVGTVLLIPLLTALFSGSPSHAWTWLGWLSLCTLAGWVTDWLCNKFGYELGFSLLDNAQHELAERLTSIKLEWFTPRNVSAARRAIAATGPDLVSLFAYLFVPMLQAVIMPLALGIALLPIAWPLGVIACLCAPLLLGTMWLSNRISRRADRQMDDTNAALSERILEFVRTQQALRASRRAEPARSHAGGALSRQHTAAMRLLALQIPGRVLFGVATQVALVAMAAAAVVLSLRGELSVVEAVALLVIIGRYLEPFVVLGDLAGAIENVSVLIGHISSVLAAPKLVPDPADSDRVDISEAPQLRLDDVTFQYGPDNPPVLDGFSLTLSPGTTAIVGPSGSGKSTILGLLAGLYRPSSGRVLIDGVDIWRLPPQERQAAVSVVFQHPYLFEGTIVDNVTAADPSADDAAVARALTRAQVDELVARLPDGERATVGEAGVALSGGERQRVSIARALLKPAPVLLIDEATSALDTENESAVVAALSGDGSGRDVHATRIVVAHRLSTIRGADRVVFLDRGEVVEDGSVPDLLAADGPFARFWAHQEQSRSWQLT